MSSTVFRGFIIAINESSCTILSEKDNLTYEYSLTDGVAPEGVLTIRQDHTLDIYNIPITGKKMVTACKNWIYDYNRSKKNYVKKTKTPPPTPTTV